MVNKSIIQRLALQSGFPDWWIAPPEPERQNNESVKMLERFAVLVAEDCKEITSNFLDYQSGNGDETYERGYEEGLKIAIRAISERYNLS